MNSRIVMHSLLTLLLVFLVGLSGCTTLPTADNRQELCAFKERIATPFNMRRVILDKPLAREMPTQTGILLCALKESNDTAVTSEVLLREDTRTLVIWVNDALLTLPAEPFFRYAIGRELLRFPDESGVCDHYPIPEYIPCELLLDDAVAKRFSSRDETAAMLRSIVATLERAGKKEQLMRIIAFRLTLFERNTNSVQPNADDGDDDITLAQK